MKHSNHFYSRVFLTSFFIAFSFIAFAQTPDEVQVAQGLWGMQKRDIVNQYMNMKPEEASKFWPIYDAYETERKKLGAERLQAISDYVNNYNALTNEKADAIIMKMFSSDEAYTHLQKTYYEKFKKEFGALKAAEFMQIELYLQTAIRFSIQDNIPFIADLEKKKK
jgi:hypothetical protein